MQILTRRSFMRGGLLGALGMALGSMLNVPGFLRRAVADTSGITWNGNKLLFIFMRGGNDALNTVIPSGDSAYNPTIRPTLYIPPPSGPLTTGGLCPMTHEPGKSIDLGNGFATLHPNLADLCSVYNAGELAIIHRVGYTNQSRSHFDSQRYWETGIPRDNRADDGLFYRALVETGLHQSQVLPAVSFSRTMPLLIKGDVPFTNVNDPNRFDLLGVYAAARQKHIDAIARMHGMPHPAKHHRDMLFPTGERFVNSIAQIEGIDFGDNDSPEFIDAATGHHLFQINSLLSNEKGFNSGTARNFFTNLKYSSQVLGHTDAVISGVEVSGFDTHNQQGNAQGGLGGAHADRMAWLGWALFALREYFSHPNVNLWNKMIVVTMTEFGRTTVENGSRGTDHAEAGAMFVAGGAIAGRGGMYQCDASSWAPGERGAMFEVNGRYLSRRVDYRSILGEIMRDHLGATQEHLNRIIPAYADPAEVLQSGGTSKDGIPIIGEVGLLS